MYSRESQKYIYSLIKKFADENSLEMEKAKEILKDGFLLEKYGSKQLEEFSKKGVVEVEEEFFIISGTFTLTLGLVSQKIADEFIEYIELALS